MNSDTLSDTVEMPAPRAPEPPAALPTTAVSVEIAGHTHPGKVRANNEDNFHVVRFGRYLRTLLSSLPEGQVPTVAKEAGYAFAVADGMGGMAAGEVASRLAITLLVEHVLDTPDWIFSGQEPYAAKVTNRAVRRFRDVNEAVLEQAATGPGLHGMGTTLSLAMTLGGDLIVAHVGDSPIFLYRGGTLLRLTRDHTMGEKLARLGVTDAGRFHHVLTHAIGIKGTGGEPEIRRYKLADADRLLLCTDGLTDMVDTDTLTRELGRDAPPDDVCRTLIDLALERGGRDNVTVVVARYHIPEGVDTAGESADRIDG